MLRKRDDGRARRFVCKGVNERKGHDKGASCVHFYVFPCLWVGVCTRFFVVFDELVKWCKSRDCGALTRIFFMCLTAVVFTHIFTAIQLVLLADGQLVYCPIPTSWNAHDQLLLKSATSHATVVDSGHVANLPIFFSFHSGEIMAKTQTEACVIVARMRTHQGAGVTSKLIVQKVYLRCFVKEWLNLNKTHLGMDSKYLIVIHAKIVYLVKD